MSVDEHPLIQAEEPPPPIALRTGHRWPLRPRMPRRRPRVRKLRLFLTVLGFSLLAFVSFLFGVAMSVTADLPKLENRAQLALVHNSYLYDDHWRPIGVLTPPSGGYGGQVLDSWSQISPAMVNAIISIEDKRFWTDPGVDVRGLLRAFTSDFTGGPTQGASTIAEQFVKNVLSEEDNRTVFEKLREAALAFQLVHHWKRTKILTEYLNTIYFGEGAYGIEAAARVYFGSAYGYDAADGADQPAGACGDSTPTSPRFSCASKLNYYQAALLAGMVANPWAFDPIAHPGAAEGRRNQVLFEMWQQGYITHAQYDTGITEPLPTASQIQMPAEPPAAPYFTSWIRPQIIAALVREGVPERSRPISHTTAGSNPHDDRPADAAGGTGGDRRRIPAGLGGPTASLVAIDNKTGEVRAMVSGDGDYQQDPFNLATLGYRQPGSSFKPFTLAEALMSGQYGPDSLIDSAPQDFTVRNSDGREHWIVHNFGNTYSGPITLQEATDISDNTVFSQVGVHIGTQKIATLATNMGVRSLVSNDYRDYAMILGGLKNGASPLDMAHAYETFATGGLKVWSKTLGDRSVPGEAGPTGIASITCAAHISPCDRTSPSTPTPTYTRELPAWVADEVHTMLEGVVTPGGTGDLAAIPGVVVAGKTGTTTNYADAWFVGWTPQMTVAVWVGYPRGDVSMATDYAGAPVEGGTYPAIIWHNFMAQALQILANEQAPHSSASSSSSTDTIPSVTYQSSGAGTAATGGTTAPATTTPAVTPTQNAPATQNTTPATQTTTPAQATTTPAQTPGTSSPSPTTTPSTTPPPTSGTSGGSGLGGG